MFADTYDDDDAAADVGGGGGGGDVLFVNQRDLLLVDPCDPPNRGGYHNLPVLGEVYTTMHYSLVEGLTDSSTSTTTIQRSRRQEAAGDNRVATELWNLESTRIQESQYLLYCVAALTGFVFAALLVEQFAPDAGPNAGASLLSRGVATFLQMLLFVVTTLVVAYYYWYYLSLRNVTQNMDDPTAVTAVESTTGGQQQQQFRFDPIPAPALDSSSCVGADCCSPDLAFVNNACK